MQLFPDLSNKVKMAVAAAVALAISLPLMTITPARAQDAGCKSCLKTASGLFSHGDNAGAAKVLTEWQVKCPENLQLLLMLNTVLNRLPGEKVKALEAADKACNLAPNNMLAHFQKAMTLMTMQQGPAASKEFERVVALDPTSYESWSALSELLSVQGDSKGAKQAGEKALQLSPSARQTQLNVLNSKNRMGNVVGVKQEISKIAEDPNTTKENLLIVGEEAFKLGYFEEAASCLSPIQSQYPDAPQIRLILPLALIEAGKPISMGADTKPAKVRVKNKGSNSEEGTVGSADYEALKGLNEMNNGNLDEGQKMIERSAGANPLDPIVALASGHLAMRLGHYKEAVEKFNDAMAKNKNLAFARLFVAQSNLAQGDWKEAISQARECQTRASGLKVAADAVELMARLRDNEDSGTNIGALKSTLQTLGPKTSDCSQSEAECALGALALKDKDFGHARELYSAAKDHNPGGVAGRIGLGHVALSEADYVAANKELDQAISRAPGNIDALSYKAIVLAATGDTAAADALLEKISKEGELPAYTCVNLAKAFQKSNQNKQAAVYFKKAMQAGLTGAALQQVKESMKAVGP